jgi:hypothetical protein
MHLLDRIYRAVMPAHSRSKNGVALLAYVVGIHVFHASPSKDVDGRNKSGHDEL